jgi:hypothetical protein
MALDRHVVVEVKLLILKNDGLGFATINVHVVNSRQLAKSNRGRSLNVCRVVSLRVELECSSRLTLGLKIVYSNFTLFPCLAHFSAKRVVF